MTKYRVNYTKTISEWVEVEADSAQDAIDEANSEGIQSLGICCTGYGQDWGREDDSESEVDFVEEYDDEKDEWNKVEA